MVNTWKRRVTVIVGSLLKSSLTLLISYFVPQSLIEHSAHTRSYFSLYVNVSEETEYWKCLRQIPRESRESQWFSQTMDLSGGPK